MVAVIRIVIQLCRLQLNNKVVKLYQMINYPFKRWQCMQDIQGYMLVVLGIVLQMVANEYTKLTDAGII